MGWFVRLTDFSGSCDLFFLLHCFFGSRPFDGFIFRGALKDVRSEVSCHSHVRPVCRFELFFHRVRPSFVAARV